jgi:hypothetical protein
MQTTPAHPSGESFGRRAERYYPLPAPRCDACGLPLSEVRCLDCCDARDPGCPFCGGEGAWHFCARCPE